MLKGILPILYFIVSLVTFVAVESCAQEVHTCAEGKLNAWHRQQKKTRAGAYANALMDRYDVHFYFLDLAIERNTTVISGSATLGVKITASQTDTFCFEFNPSLTIDSIIWNNTSISYARSAAITYALLPTLSMNTLAYIKVYYHGDASVTGASAIGDGFNTGTSSSWGNRATWSLSEPYSAYEWFPCKQFLQDKADSAWVFITTDSTNKGGSNGLLEGVDTGLPGGKVRYRWKTHYPIAYYLISVAVARYVEYTNYAYPAALPNDSIPIVNYVYNNPATLNSFQDDLDSIPMLLEFFSDEWGLYPFYQEKYGHCMAPFSGGMEHQTMSSMGNLGSFAINAHELGHHWFGDHVTCKTWHDIYINEGFASYAEYLAYEAFRGWTAAQNRMLSVHNNVMSDPDGSVYCPDTQSVSRIFSSRLTYNKGSAVTHTLRFLLGDSLFRQVLREFQQIYSFSTASIQDLKHVAESVSGLNLQDYFDQWIYGEGFPTFQGEFASDGQHLFLKINQTTSTTTTPLFKTPLEIKCLSTDGDTIIRVNILQNQQVLMIPCTRFVYGLQIDPNNWILNETGPFVENQLLIPTLIDHITASSMISVYPVPATEQLILESKAGYQIPYSLFNAAGMKMLEGKLDKQERISLLQWPSGFYWINFDTPQGKVIRRIIR